MADNTAQAGSDVIATDDVATLNGAASSGVKVQRVKVGFGDDGTHRDASSTYPLPVEMGTDITTPTAMPAGGVGVRGWLSAIWTKLNGTVNVGVQTGNISNGNSYADLLTGFLVYGRTPGVGPATGARSLIVDDTTGALTVIAATLPLPTGAAQDGTDITTPTAMPAGGAGIRGWLSAIWTKLNGTLNVTGTGTAGTPAAGVQTVQGIAGGKALPVARTIDGTRTRVTMNYNSAAPAAADTLLTLALNKGGTATSVTTVPVTAGKVLRITHVIVGLRTTTAVLPYGLVTLRINDTGAAVLATPAAMQVAVSGTAAVIGNTGTTPASLEDGLELSGTQQLAISFSNNVNTNVVSISVVGYEYTP